MRSPQERGRLKSEVASSEVALHEVTSLEVASSEIASREVAPLEAISLDADLARGPAWRRVVTLGKVASSHRLEPGDLTRGRLAQDRPGSRPASFKGDSGPRRSTRALPRGGERACLFLQVRGGAHAQSILRARRGLRPSRPSGLIITAATSSARHRRRGIVGKGRTSR